MSNKKSVDGQSNAQEDTTILSQKSKKSKYLLKDKVCTGSMKFYAEQVPDEKQFIEKIKRYQKNGNTGIQILAIKHNRDEARNGDHWGSSILKPHWHLIFRCVDRKFRIRFSTISNELGIEWRKGVDDELLSQPHTIETCRNFGASALYLTHETEQAIQDAKELYLVSEIVSNLNEEEIEQVRQGYIRVSENRRVSQAEMMALDKEAFNLGRDLKDFLSWFTDLPFEVRANAKMKVVHQSYDNGVQLRMRDKDSLKVQRLCIFIKGFPDCGKTYAANEIASQNGLTYLVDSDGTGKFDKLLPSHKSIVINDQVCPNLLNMCDDLMCQVYKRNSNNPIWTGDLFIVTSNLDFMSWLDECGIKDFSSYNNWTHRWELNDRGKAIASRFFICEIVRETRQLYCLREGSRGTEEELSAKLNRFAEFKEKYNKILLTYDKNIEAIKSYSEQK